MTATAIITIGDIRDGGAYRAPYASVTAECSECGHKVFTAGPPGRDWSRLLDDHLDQHKPGRAFDIEVDWEPSARCSVCEDGIGDVRQEDDGLTCQKCGTYWSIDGRHGYREEA